MNGDRIQQNKEEAKRYFEMAEYDDQMDLDILFENFSRVNKKNPCKLP